MDKARITSFKVDGRSILGLGEDNRMYLWNYQDASWDLLQHE